MESFLDLWYAERGERREERGARRGEKRGTRGEEINRERRGRSVNKSLIYFQNSSRKVEWQVELASCVIGMTVLPLLYSFGAGIQVEVRKG